MWKRQIRAEQAATEAKIATDRAAALQRQATTLTRPSSPGDGADSENISESDNEPMLQVPHNTPEKMRKSPSSFASRADGFHLAAALSQGSSDNKPSGHP